MTKEAHWDVVVIGAGAAGILAATRAAERGRRVLLIEKNRKPGVKILMSGGTRCNLTHATDRRGIVEAFGKQGRFLHSALAALSPDDVVELVEAEGVPTKVEETGKIFPVSNRAIDVVGALMARLRRSSATLCVDEPVQRIEVRAGEPGSDTPTPSRFQLTTSKRTIVCENLILTTGGQSFPGCGTTGDGYVWAKSLGHSIVPPRPALVPITVDADWVKALQGITVHDAMVSVRESPGCDHEKPRKKCVLDERRGPLLFTHFGLSGPIVLDVSRTVTGHPHPKSLRMVCDFVPAVPQDDLDARLKSASTQEGKKQMALVLADYLPRRLAAALLEQCGIPHDQRGAQLQRAQRTALLTAIKATELPVTGTRGFKKAEVTAGGVPLDEVDSRTMESKHMPGVYMAGEILDLDGPIGGYNFQAAFSTGYLAGGSV